jgi:hypothetical protein
MDIAEQEKRYLGWLKLILERFRNGELEEDKFIVNIPKENLAPEQIKRLIIEAQDINDQLLALVGKTEAISSWYQYKYDRTKTHFMGQSGPLYEKDELGNLVMDENGNAKEVKLKNDEQRKAWAMEQPQVRNAYSLLASANSLHSYFNNLSKSSQTRIVSLWNFLKSSSGYTSN